MQGRFWMGHEFPSPPTETTSNSPSGSRGKGCSVSRDQKCPLAGLAGPMYSIPQQANSEALEIEVRLGEGLPGVKGFGLRMGGGRSLTSLLTPHPQCKHRALACQNREKVERATGSPTRDRFHAHE